jgi:hypothetical protein
MAAARQGARPANGAAEEMIMEAQKLDELMHGTDGDEGDVCAGRTGTGHRYSLLVILGQFVSRLYQRVSAMYQRFLIHRSRISDSILYQLCISKIILIHLSLIHA